ncbi:MAG: guanylate kinase [Muribaculaceae bacterium]
MKNGKIIVIAAPSGCGKSTIIKALFDEENASELDLRFSISATTREPRPGEKEGVNYYFMTEEAFRDAIVEGEFLEYEEVYPGRFYGTLRSEVDRIIEEGHNVLLDIDVNGALGVKKIYGDRALTIFVRPPSVDELRRRLEARGTETPDVIDQRIDRAEYELSRSPMFDRVVVNDELDEAVRQTRNLVDGFVSL